MRLIGLVLLAFMLDKFVCFVYCTMKKRQIQVKNSQGEVINSGRNNTNGGVKVVIKRLLYGWMMYSIERLGRVPLQKYRIFILKKIYRMDIGKNVVIYHGFHIRAPWNIRIGKGTIVGDGVLLDGRNGLDIGENVNISTEACIYTEQHDINDPYFACADSGGRVVIGNRVWLSSRTTVLPKVTIGDGAVLASSALTAKDLDEYTMYGGIPAKKIGERSRNLQYEFDGTYVPFY